MNFNLQMDKKTQESLPKKCIICLQEVWELN